MFNEKLKELRLSKDLSQRELAVRLGCSKSTIAMYESGLREPNFEMLETIADFFNVNMSALIDKATDTLEPVFDGQILTRSTLPNSPDTIVTDKIMYFMPDNSLLFDGIPKNAQLKIKKTTTPHEKDIIAVMLNGEIVVRHYSRSGEVILLTASNPKYDAIVTTETELRETKNGIIGKVVNVSFDL